MNDHVAYGRVAVLVPCYNEETAISQVIKGFRAALPEATIYVYDASGQGSCCASYVHRR
jgi:hypothetical protein